MTKIFQSCMVECPNCSKTFAAIDSEKEKEELRDKFIQAALIGLSPLIASISGYTLDKVLKDAILTADKIMIARKE